MSRKPHKRISEERWGDIRMRYIHTNLGVRELYDEFKDEVSYEGIAKRCKQEKWVAARQIHQLQIADKKERESVDLATDGITVEAQAKARKDYIQDAGSIMARVRAVLSDEDSKLDSIDLQRLATTARTCQQIEFLSLRIPIDAIDITDRTRSGPMTWLDMMMANRKKKGLSQGGP